MKGLIISGVHCTKIQLSLGMFTCGRLTTMFVGEVPAVHGLLKCPSGED